MARLSTTAIWAEPAPASRTLQHAWTEFARTGVPRNPDGTPCPAGTVAAPRLTVIEETAHTRPFGTSPVAELINSLRTAPENR